MNSSSMALGPFASPFPNPGSFIGHRACVSRPDRKSSGNYQLMLAGPEFSAATRQDFDVLLFDLERAARKAPHAPPMHLALSNAVCFALTHHAYPLAASLVKDHRPDALILELASDWQARDANFARLFDGLAVSSLTLGAYDGRDADAAFGGALSVALTHLAARMIQAGTTHEVTLLNALPPAAQNLFCGALASGGITSCHLLPHFSNEAQLSSHRRQVLDVLTALGNCRGLRNLSVNFAALGAQLSRVLNKGTLTALTLDMDHFGPLQALDDAELAAAFSGLHNCGRLQSLTIRHGAIAPAALNEHVLARLAGNQSIQELAIRSDLPLHGGEPHIGALATSFELLNTCGGLRTFRLECPAAASPARVAREQLYALGKDSDHARASASVRLASALRVSPLRRLFINGLVMHGATALGLACGLGGNASLEELDLSGCGFPLNHAPQFIRNLEANESIRLMAMPAPQSMIFHAESDGSLCDLMQRGNTWDVDACADSAKKDFEAFEGGGADYAQNFAYLACAKVAHRNAQLRSRR